MNSDFKLSCVLFDLDGTLVDTAPDLIACLNHALSQHGFPSARGDRIKPFISYGAAAMIKASLGHAATGDVQSSILETMLDHYQRNIAEHTVFYSGMPETLDAIEALGLKWGVVTNKLKRFTLPLMEALDLTRRAACIISGDTTSHSKPHPEPMLAGCEQACVPPKECVYIGDASHDIEAGKNVGMKTLAALYGYLKPDDIPTRWGADGFIEYPEQINSWIKTTLCH
ncbi:MAG: HAD family hydrolase [Gammaproteobacteria bacterium]